MTTWPLSPRDVGRNWRAETLVVGGLLLFVLAVYAAVVVGGGWLLGQASLPGLPLAVIATTAVALAFDRVHRQLRSSADRVLHSTRVDPFEVLSRFSGAVTGQYAVEDVPERMAQVLADGTGATWAEVWIAAGDRMVLAARWPADTGTRDQPPGGDRRVEGHPGRRWREVRHASSVLGVLVLQERPGVRLTAVEDRLFSGLAAQAGLALRSAVLLSELEQRADELAARVLELQGSRQRLVDAQDDERRRIERDIHDGAQQHLVALAVNLRLAQTLSATAPDRARAVLAQQEEAAREGVDTLVRLTHGIYPATLSDHGVVAALQAAAATSPVPVVVEGTGVGRLSPRVEAAAYFCSTEALQNAAKHAQATRVRVELHLGSDGSLTVCVEDDGRGFDLATVAGGRGFANMRERLVALDGSLDVSSTTSGTRVRARIPVPAGA